MIFTHFVPESNAATSLFFSLGLPVAGILLGVCLHYHWRNNPPCGPYTLYLAAYFGFGLGALYFLAVAGFMLAHTAIDLAQGSVTIAADYGYSEEEKISGNAVGTGSFTQTVQRMHFKKACGAEFSLGVSPKEVRDPIRYMESWEGNMYPTYYQHSGIYVSVARAHIPSEIFNEPFS
ncbi:hypothetical protein [Bifidobacterium sp.]|uniref:hypothetical protein n=1 Tax=Bifidobacterium sp. TaxID=41200 RepID=UPI0025C1A9A6|nr:hypothetical protein [Bifidobacterium sp.]MCH4209530.1 hypothetical protein [Bifidobacterium sp.]MCI1224814.1 hypothetical protein [Bifidobacterium sp.]